MTLWHKGSKPVACRFWLLFIQSLLRCICFKVYFTESNYLVSNWSYSLLV